MGQFIRVILPAIVLAGCSAGNNAPKATPPAPGASDWRAVATPEDRRRLREWRTAFVAALDEARSAGRAAEVARHGKLAEPDAGRYEKIPPGRYECRTLKLGATTPGETAYKLYPFQPCAIANEGDVSSFALLTGVQRPTGLIFNSGDGRQIFLGTMMLGDEKRALDYGRDMDRDMAGAIEKLDDGRWRLVLPYPHFESMLDIVEIIPVGGSRPASSGGK